MEAGTWQGIVVPAKTPKDVIDTLNKAIAKSLATPAVKDKLAQQGVDPSPSTPEEFRTLIADDLKRWHDVITGANIKID
jgi:tripartite-type tricarboxylate transporter receptor subunit TctC